jgi:hypothetical protein
MVVFNETTRRGLAWPNYLDILQRPSSFESIAAYRRTAFTVIDAANARRFDGRYVTAGFLDVLGVRPQLGRTFNTHDDRVGADPVIIVSALRHE